MDQVFKSQVDAIKRSIQSHDKHSIPMPNNTQWNSSVTSFRLAAGETYISSNEKKKKQEFSTHFMIKNHSNRYFLHIGWHDKHHTERIKIAMFMKSKMHLHFR